ncbi:hypothetical protein [Lactobacillus jensenii]|uniref:hypothetical protein n=1 Tax=Lactobacillus jensenii TaxID=109790 RepID=UPI00287016CE|nr:hypothetical protein [Lactobacillus jensenii]
MNNKEAAKLVASAMGAAILAGVIGSNNTNQKVEAATNNQQVRGVLRVKYNGLGGVNLLDNNGHFQDKYVYNNSAFKVWEKATINDQTMYRIGTQKQWIPAQYTNWDDGSSRKQNVNAVTIKYVPGYGINLWKTPASKEWTGRRLPHNSSWKVFGTAVGDDGYVWYNLGGDQWIPSRYTNKPIKAAASDSNVVTIKYVPGYGINLWKTPASKEWTGRRLAHNSSWRVYKTAVGDDGYIWYNLGGDQWIPSRYTNRPVKASSSATSSQSSKASSSSASSAASSQSSKASSSSASSAVSSQSSKASSSSASSASASQSGSSSENSGFTSNNGIWTDSERQEAEQYFLQLVNEWNAKQGNTVPFVINSEKQSLAEFRAQQNIESIEKTGDIDDHMPNGVPFLNQPEFKNSKVPVVTEVQGMQGSASGMTPKEFVDAAFDAFIYRDGPSWQHRESLRSGTKEELEVDSLPFGVGIKQVRHNGMIINVIDALI